MPQLLLVPFVALVNIYMLRLIKDVDNPFDFKEGARDQSSGEVALFPVDEYRERLAARVGQGADPMPGQQRFSRFFHRRGHAHDGTRIVRSRGPGGPGHRRQWRYRPRHRARLRAGRSGCRNLWPERGPVDVLVNNAGIANLSGGILQETAKSWDKVIETQLNAVFLLSKLAAASMVGRKRGKIINLGSMYSYFGAGPIPSYSAAKGAIVQLTKSMAIELAPHGIQVNAIAPGWIETDMTAAVRTEALKAMNDEILARTPAGRWGQPSEIAGTAIFLASSASDFVTGETIRVDGGYAIR
ncbi:MAG: SDR family oxidoreductase [Steroidobacteraceae bacterium]